MGLVAYEDDSDVESPPPVKPTKPTKKRILLDLPPLVDSTGPPVKRQKPNNVAVPTASKGKSGLTALLPMPKSDSVKPTLRAEPLKGGALARDLGLDLDDNGRVKGTGGFVKEAFKLSVTSPITLPNTSGSQAALKIKTEESRDATDSTTTSLDFFGLSELSVPTIPKKSKTTVSAAPTIVSVTPSTSSISSAPAPAPRPPSPTSIYEFAGQPTTSDPYPGFRQLTDGNWEPKNVAAWTEYCRLCGIDPTSCFVQPEEAPKDFDLPADETKMVNVSGHVKKEEKPEIKRPDRETMVVNMKTTAQEITRVAKSRHQLTSLLIDAQKNRDEIEDRIAAAKINRRAGARNYGF